MKIICVCKYCGHSEKEDPIIEINFRDQKIYYYCPKCQKSGQESINILQFSDNMKPYPRIKRM
jgi:hypothetical protein